MRLNLPPGLHHQLQLRLLLPLRLQLVGELPLQRHLLAQRRLLSLEVLVQCVRIGRPRRSGGASGVGRRVKGGGRGGPRYGARAAAPLHPRRLGGPRLAVAVAGPRRALVHHAAVLLEVRLDVCLGEAVDVHQLEDGLWLGVVEAELVARRLELRVQLWGPNEAWPGLLVQLGNRRRRRERWRKGGRRDRNVEHFKRQVCLKLDGVRHAARALHVQRGLAGHVVVLVLAALGGSTGECSSAHPDALGRRLHGQNRQS
mmetsp:Transcript_36871/g.123498  ORF Transcript_36871/g.123498 Transcript_36871/m.123498 type:complete len:257 (+) Transcript_36871:509-1279(+)